MKQRVAVPERKRVAGAGSSIGWHVLLVASLLSLLPVSAQAARASASYQIVSDVISTSAGASASAQYRLSFFSTQVVSSDATASQGFVLRSGPSLFSALLDDDGDGSNDDSDNCLGLHNPDQTDTDGDGFGDACDTDKDGDSVVNAADNCPLVGNASQADVDLDGLGDACDTDADSDGVENVFDNCPLVGNADQADLDGDGIGDACDTDRDGDGVASVADNCPSVENAGQSDLDGDGLGDACDTDTDGDGTANIADNCPLAGNAGQADLDLDGIGDACDTDTDGDQLPDIYEESHGLDPLDPLDAGGDADGDGLSNLAEYQSDTNPNADDNPPQVTPPADITVNSTGTLTRVNLGSAVATDAVDGNLAAVANPTGPFLPGVHDVTWTATDAAGNQAAAIQTVSVRPLVNFAPSQVAGEGTSVTVSAWLNGPAPVYPVEVPFTVGGTADDDHDAINGIITIASGTEGRTSFQIAADGALEGDETVVFTMGTPINAVAGPRVTHTVTIRETNEAPRVVLRVLQGAAPTRTIIAGGGPVQVSAEVSDPNPSDSHGYDWSGTDNSLVRTNGANQASFEFDPAALAPGLYRVALTVRDDGAPVASTAVDVLLKVILQAPALSGSTDSDGDGVDDATEGLQDGDEDGIPDYIDAHDDPAVLPAGSDASGYLLSTEPGLQLRLGSTAFAAGTNGARVSDSDVAQHGGAGGGTGASAEEIYSYEGGLFDFEVHDLPVAGGTVQVVIPQQTAVAQGAVYRKYRAGSGWDEFVVDTANAVASAPGSLGVCPSAGASDYEPGLSAGHYCVQLTIEDGGPNDADGVANGHVRDPGGVATPVVSDSASTSSGGGGATGLLALLAGLLLYPVARSALENLARKETRRRHR